MLAKDLLVIIGVALLIPTLFSALGLAINLALKIKPKLNRKMAAGVLAGICLLAIYIISYGPILGSALSCKAYRAESDQCVALIVSVRLNHAGNYVYLVEVGSLETKARACEVWRWLLPHSLANAQAEEVVDKALADYSGSVQFTIIDHFNPGLKTGQN